MLKLSCTQATRLMSEGQERELGASERTLLRMHTWICSGCRNFGKQLGFMRLAMKGFSAHDATGDGGDGGGNGNGNEGPPAGGA